MKPDKLIITAEANACTIQALNGGRVVAERTLEYVAGECYAGTGDDLYESLPVDLASTWHDMQMDFMDIMLALMPARAAA